MIVLLKQDEEAMVKDIVSNPKTISSFYWNRFFNLVWRIHELAENDFEQGRFRRRRYRQQMRQLQMETSSIHQSPYGHQSVPSFYPSPSTPYYMCSPSPPSYHSMYSTPNTSTEIASPTSYPLYDPYSMSYYSTPYHPMASSYASPNESGNFDV
jgi:hypothetical protein